MLNRRRVLVHGAAASIALKIGRSLAAQASNRVVVGVMGLSRGMDLATELAAMPGVTIKYLCDADSQRLSLGMKRIGESESESASEVQSVTDFRKMLDDKDIDAIFCAAPNHWHGPATIMACKAGKHVYVEKPCSHNPQEGEWMIEAAQRFQRCVQVGTQRRSSATVREAIQKLHEGVIGRVYLAKAFFQRMRGPIGRGNEGTPPGYLDYELWQGPTPRRPYRDNIIHYNWHWFWHYGNGELGNNGIHCLDLCRWGLNVDYPIRTTSSGGRYCYDDDQETPDTHSAAFEFEGGKQITYDGVSCSQHPPGPFVLFYGMEGAMEMDGDGGYRIFDAKNKLIEEVRGSNWGQTEHITNFLEAIRSQNPAMLNQPVLEGHKSTLLCHLGNIAYRTGKTVQTDSQSGRILYDAEQQQLLRRSYDPRWEADVTLA